MAFHELICTYMLIVVGGIKGGSGKTTIATNLAVMRAKNHSIMLVDADEQKSVSDWVDQRKDQNISTNWTTVQLTGKNIYTELKQLRDRYDDIIIDVGGRDTTSQRSALVVADKFIVPFKPRSLDIWTLGKLKSMVNEITTVNQKLTTIAVINQADSRGTDNEDANKILDECVEINCVNFFIGNRKAFANAASDGLSVVEMENPDKKACAEMMMLYEHIFQVNHAH